MSGIRELLKKAQTGPLKPRIQVDVRLPTHAYNRMRDALVSHLNAIPLDWQGRIPFDQTYVSIDPEILGFMNEWSDLTKTYDYLKEEFKKAPYNTGTRGEFMRGLVSHPESEEDYYPRYELLDRLEKLVGSIGDPVARRVTPLTILLHPGTYNVPKPIYLHYMLFPPFAKGNLFRKDFELDYNIDPSRLVDVEQSVFPYVDIKPGSQYKAHRILLPLRVNSPDQYAALFKLYAKLMEGDPRHNLFLDVVRGTRKKPLRDDEIAYLSNNFASMLSDSPVVDELSDYINKELAKDVTKQVSLGGISWFEYPIAAPKDLETVIANLTKRRAHLPSRSMQSQESPKVFDLNSDFNPALEGIGLIAAYGAYGSALKRAINSEEISPPARLLAKYLYEHTLVPTGVGMAVPIKELAHFYEKVIVPTYYELFLTKQTHPSKTRPADFFSRNPESILITLPFASQFKLKGKFDDMLTRMGLQRSRAWPLLRSDPAFRYYSPIPLGN